MTFKANFNGRFSIDQKVNETTYFLNLDRADITSPVGTVDHKKTNDGRDMDINYTDLPYGLAKDNENDFSFQDKFTLYLPHKKVADMGPEVRRWLEIRQSPYIDEEETRIFILVNNSTKDTFLEVIDERHIPYLL